MIIIEIMMIMMTSDDHDSVDYDKEQLSMKMVIQY